MITDEEIAELLAIPKMVINPRAKKRKQRSSIQITYSLKTESRAASFDLYTRQNTIDLDNYSCGLSYHHPSGERIHLVRYNGSSHEHRNPLESNELIRFACHIHRATQRYIEMGDKAEKFAETTDRYSSLEGALRCLVMDCNVLGLHTTSADFSAESQLSLLND